MQQTTCSAQPQPSKLPRASMLRDINIATIEWQKDTACGSGEESLDTHDGSMMPL
jgi:hypothetical protein